MNNIKNNFMRLDSFLYRAPRYAHNFRVYMHPITERIMNLQWTVSQSCHDRTFKIRN